jgi:anhydro-N-acetylmuramic acid kinase
MKPKKVHKYKVIGIMSGTSLDGIDVAYCKFTVKNKKWSFSIQTAQTFSYTIEWRNKLSSAHTLPGQSLMQLHSAYGKYLGQICKQFIKQKKIKKIDLIASHGHTIFHQPKNKFTFQLGDGDALHAATGYPVSFNFRGLDVALGGEGAPLVPIGDQLLFFDYDICLNLGGIANLSMEINGQRKAFDICFCNMALNYLAAKVGKEFDRHGSIARRGSINPELLHSLEQTYNSVRGKRPSLSREGFEKEIKRLLDNESIALNDRLRTVCESIAEEIMLSIPQPKEKIKLYATGGGAFNTFLMELIEGKLSFNTKLIVPSKTIVNFKEAVVFALLGVLCKRKEINVLKSVTGASRNSSSGALIG